MAKLAIKPTSRPIIKHNLGLIEIPIKKGNNTNKILIYSSLLEVKPAQLIQNTR